MKSELYVSGFGSILRVNNSQIHTSVYQKGKKVSI